MLALADALRRRGHAVTFCAPPDFERWVARHGLPFHPLGRSFQAFLTEIGTAYLRGLVKLRHDVPAEFARIAALVGGADVVVGASLHHAGRSLAEKAGIPYAHVIFSPPFVLPPGGGNAGWWVTRLAWNALFRRSMNRQRARLGLAPVGDVYRHLFGPPLLLASEPALGPPPPGAEVRQTGAWFLADDEPLDPALARFLAHGPPPVYIGFGSTPSRSAGAMTALVAEAIAQAGVRAVIGRGWAGLGNAPLGPAVHVAEAPPHQALFARVAAAVHHGGAGTTAAAARAGIPQVVIPHVLDQFFWAERVQALGLGPPPIHRRRLTARRLAAAVRAAVEGAEMQARARAFAAGMVADGVDRAADAVEALAAGRFSPAP
jgi:UDP:flavonoid glycosyltransferase YjiC (YdhE family)